MNALLLAWMTEAGLMTYRTAKGGRPSVAGGGKIPWPADYLATFVFYGALAGIAEISPAAQGFAALTGWGMVLATLLNLYDPTFGLEKARNQQPQTFNVRQP